MAPPFNSPEQASHRKLASPDHCPRMSTVRTDLDTDGIIQFGPIRHGTCLVIVLPESRRIKVLKYFEPIVCARFLGYAYG